MSQGNGRRSTVIRLAGGVGLVVLMACLPLLNIVVPGVLPGATYTPGTLHLLALAMLTAAVALSYHLLLGVAGLLSFGHALYFGAGVYGLGVILEQWEIPLLPAMGLTLVLVIVLANVLGAISLRVTGIPFAMVTLSFAQAGNVLARRDPGDLTGGEEGLSLNTSVVPDFLVGVADTRNLYWLSLAALVLTYVLVTWVQSSRAGHVAEAVRENELRVRVLGMQPYAVKLVIFVAAATIAGGVGMIYLLLQNNAVPHVLSADYTITLLLMVVLGGVGSRWGAIAGAVVYTLLVQRLTVLASSEAVAGLPAVLRIPLSEPMFILGTLFVLVVLFLPGGIAGGAATLRRRRPGRAGTGVTDDLRGRQDVDEHPLEDVVTEPR
jgi:branched-chain amino acid transport system permease protein